MRRVAIVTLALGCVPQVDSAYPCETDRDCTRGWKCHPQDLFCVREIGVLCNDECQAVAQAQCVGADREVCEIADDGCLVWSEPEACPELLACESTTGECTRDLTWLFYEPAPHKALYGVWGASADHVWAVGADGFCLFFGPSGVWQEVATPTVATLRSVWGSAPDELWAVGDGGIILQHTAALGWVEVSSPTSADLYVVWGSWAAGDDGTLLFNDGTWSVQDPLVDILERGVNIRALWGTGDEMWAAGEQWIFHKTGETWTREVDPNYEDFYPVDFSYAGAWGTATDDVWIVGSSGYVVHYNGAELAGRRYLVEKDLKAVWASSRSNVWSVGESGYALHSDGVTWPALHGYSPDDTETFEGIWGARRDDAWIVGHKSDGSGVLWRLQ